MALPLSEHHKGGARPISLFMQRELSAIQFERPNTVAGGEVGFGAPTFSKSWAGQSAGFGGPKTLGVTPYATKLRRHYELKNTPACASRTVQHQHRRRSHFQGSTMLLDARQASAAASTMGMDATLSLEELNERARENLKQVQIEEGVAGLGKVYGGAHADKDTADHFRHGTTNLTDESEWVTRLPAGAKDRYGSEYMNDRAVSYDMVYGAEHEGKDTESHFKGMQLGGAEELEAAERAQREMWARARAEQAERDRNYVEQTHMGHEQADGKGGDTYAPGWKGSSMLMADEPGGLHGMTMDFDNVYGDRHRGWDTADHFKGGSILMSGDEGAPVEMSFDSIYSDKYNGLRSKSHFQRGSLVADDVPYRPPPRVLTTSRGRRMEPPPRAKFLGRGYDLSKNRELVGPWRVTPIKGKASWDLQKWEEVAAAGLSSGPRSPLSLGHSGSNKDLTPQGPAGGAQVFGESRGGTPSGTPKQLLHMFTPAVAPVAE